MRVFPETSPFAPDPAAAWNEQTSWQAWWVDCPAAGQTPFFTVYRLRVEFDAPVQLRCHISADERYILFLDNERLGRGSERGEPLHWFYESYDLKLAPGARTLWAVVWSLGRFAPSPQMSVQPGFLFAVEGEYLPLSTGLGNWETALLPSWELLEQPNLVDSYSRGWRFRFSRPFPNAESLDEFDWQPARRVTRARDQIQDWLMFRQRRLQPAVLPPMISAPFPLGALRSVTVPPSAEVQNIPLPADGKIESRENWSAFAAGKTEITLPPHAIRRVIFDLQNYLTAYPELTVSGGQGTLIRLGWAESPRLTPDWENHAKGHRDELAGKFLLTVADEFLLDGKTNARHAPLWWQAGRYVELVIAAADKPVTLHKLTLEESRYPLEMTSRFDCDDPRLTSALPLLIRGLQMNAGEIFFDCPYYEESQFIGDTRLQSLCHAVMTRDDRLTRKALHLLDASRQPDGFLQAEYPSRYPAIIAPFSLYWIGMLWDYAHWRVNPDLVRTLLPGMRSTLEAFRRHVSADGLLHAPEGWNFMDWTDSWGNEGGIPPNAITGVSATLHWQLVYALNMAAELEAHLGEKEFAVHYTRWGAELARAGQSAFWDEASGLFSDDLAHTSYSEHPQTFAILSRHLPPEQITRIASGLRHAKLHRASYFFLHYLLEAYRLLNLDDLIHVQLRRWHIEMVEIGLKTPLEGLEPSRSDCHAWSSHPLYHYFATVLGIRPLEPEFARVEITPHLGDLTRAEGVLIHPQGETRVAFRRETDGWHCEIHLPNRVRGVLRLDGQVIEFENTLSL